MSIKVGVNGFGRIGRYFTRMALQRSDIEVVAVNDLTDVKTLAHLFKYDSVHGKLNMDVRVEGNAIVLGNGNRIEVSAERDPSNIKWAAQGVEYVLDSTGIFKSLELASKHLEGGAKKVMISAPPSGDGVKSVVVGVNDDILDANDIVVSNASCTTNCAAPMIKVMREICDIDVVYISTIHSYTSDQRLHDAPHSDLRRARAAAESIIPTSTGAAKAVSKIFPELKGKMGGSALRVPVANGSLVDMTITTKSNVTVEQINSAFEKAALGDLKGVLEYTNEPIVSKDIVGNSKSCIFDAELTQIVDNNMIKIIGWYDNEAGYATRCVDLMVKLSNL
jgi:glyceraldehyde 3-phosphate dehydrogenase